jgi:hypothetical protein
MDTPQEPKQPDCLVLTIKAYPDGRIVLEPAHLVVNTILAYGLLMNAIDIVREQKNRVASNIVIPSGLRANRG